MEVEGVVHFLLRVGPLALHQAQRVPLYPKVDGGGDPHIRHAEQVGLPRDHIKGSGLGSPVDQNTIR